MKSAGRHNADDLRHSGTDNWARRKIEQARAHQESIFNCGLNGLEIVCRRDKQIELSTGETLTEFLSCSYLGLETDSRLIEAAVDAVRQFGVQFAAARTRAAVTPMREYDLRLGAIFNGYTVTFNSVTNTHLGVLPLLASGEIPSFPVQRNGILWIMDRAAHASMQILQGLMCQFGKMIRLPSNDLEQVEEACRAAGRQGLSPVILTDTVGSMQGLYPIRQLLDLAARYDGYVYADDAHGTSIHGRHGGGFALAQCDNRLHPSLILISSLSKAFGATGGAVTVPTEVDVKMVQRYSSTYIFGGPLSLAGVAAGVESAKIHMSAEIQELQTKLWDNVAHIDHLFGSTIGNYRAASPVRCIRVGKENDAINLSLALRLRGFAVMTAMFPTVAKGKAVLRLAISAAHRREELERLAMSVSDAVREQGISGLCDPDGNERCTGS